MYRLKIDLTEMWPQRIGRAQYSCTVFDGGGSRRGCVSNAWHSQIQSFPRIIQPISFQGS